MKNKEFSKVMVSTLATAMVINPLIVSADTIAKGLKSSSEVINSEDVGAEDISSVGDISSLGLNEPVVKDGGILRESSNSIYLSNIEYDKVLSYTKWKDIMKDANTDGVKIRLLVDGEVTTFAKGMGAHATSELVYDVSAYTDEYTYLSMYLGLDYGQLNRGSNGVKFTIFTSDNCSDWTPIHTTGVMLPENNAEYVKLDVSNVKYIKLYASDNGKQNNDHSVYGDIRLIKRDYDINSEKLTCIKKVSEYDEEIKSLYSVGDELTEQLKRLILERTFVSRFGYNNIQQLAMTSIENKEALEWVFRDEDALRLFIEAGTLTYGDSVKSLEAFCRLYKAHNSDLSPVNLKSATYKKMMIATAVAYCRYITSYITTYGGYSKESDPLLKYELFKGLYDDGKFLRPEEFDNYCMELVRFVMDARMDDDEIRWLRYYSEDRYPSNTSTRLNPYSFIRYIQPNYGKAEFYSEDNRQKWEDKYSLAKYGMLTYGEAGRARLWMEMEHGGICWNISGLGINLNEVHGLPSINVFQPNHEAYLTYSQDAKGIGTWSIGNNVSGWASSYTRWGSVQVSKARMLLGWGNQYYSKDAKNNATYILLGQAALNDYANYIESNYYVLLAESYSEAPLDRVTIYNKSLEEQSFNLDALHGLIKAYEQLSDRTSGDWLNLAKRIIKEYTYYPVVMVDLLNLLKDNVTDSIHITELDMLKTSALNKASVATANESLQPAACKEIAKSLLGSETVNLATFSFDGENAGKILINEKYDQYGIRVRYSVDGGITYKETEEHIIPLSEEDLERINDTDDLIVGLIGTQETFTIDIKPGVTITNSIVFKNDIENKFFGDIRGLEYSTDGGANWSDYTSDIRFDGYQRVNVRYKARDTYLASKDVYYTFNEDSNTPERTYISIDHLTLDSFSTQQNATSSAAQNMIDGIDNTGWHTKYSYTDPDKFYTVKLDRVRYISAIEYLPGGANGRLRDAEVYTSLDGKEWYKAGGADSLPNTNAWKTLDLYDPTPARYVKIVATSTWGNSVGEYNMYFSGMTFNYFEDTTQTYKPDVKVEYSETKPTNGNVLATLVLPSGCEAVDGITEYEFTENTTYTFKYTDANGDEHSIEASVSNIDREVPKGTITYSTTDLTDEGVVATLVTDKEVTITSGGVVDNTYTFTTNGTYTFEFVDEAGNVGSVEAKVDWIYAKKPTDMVVYNNTKEDNDKPLVVELDVNLEEVEILNEEGLSAITFTKNGDYTFKLRLRETGYEFEITIVVDWLDEDAIEEGLKEEEDKEDDSVVGGDTSDDKDDNEVVDGDVSDDEENNDDNASDDDNLSTDDSEDATDEEDKGSVDDSEDTEGGNTTDDNVVGGIEGEVDTDNAPEDTEDDVTNEGEVDDDNIVEDGDNDVENDTIIGDTDNNVEDDVIDEEDKNNTIVSDEKEDSSVVDSNTTEGSKEDNNVTTQGNNKDNIVNKDEIVDESDKDSIVSNNTNSSTGGNTSNNSNSSNSNSTTSNDNSSTISEKTESSVENTENTENTTTDSSNSSEEVVESENIEGLIQAGSVGGSTFDEGTESTFGDDSSVSTTKEEVLDGTEIESEENSKTTVYAVSTGVGGSLLGLLAWLRRRFF